MKNLLILIFVLLNVSSSFAIEIKIIHKIQNEIITNIDIKNEFKYLLAFNKKLKELDNETIFNISNDSLVRDKIREIEVKKRFEVTQLNDEYLNMLINLAYTNLGLRSLDEFEAYLKNNNLTLNDIKKKITIESLWRNLILTKYKDQITVNEQEIKNKLNNYKNKTIKEFQLSEILFEVKNKEEIVEKYNKIIESINKIGFANSASIYSFSESAKIGGNIGWIKENSLSNAIKEKIILLNIGEISKPIILSNGILILKIINAKKSTIDFDIEVEFKRATEYEKKRKFTQYSNIYFNKVKKNLEFND